MGRWGSSASRPRSRPPVWTSRSTAAPRTATSTKHAVRYADCTSMASEEPRLPDAAACRSDDHALRRATHSINSARDRRRACAYSSGSRVPGAAGARALLDALAARDAPGGWGLWRGRLERVDRTANPYVEVGRWALAVMYEVC